MPEIVLKCLRVVVRRREAAALGPRVTVLVLAGAMSRSQQGRAGLQTFIHHMALRWGNERKCKDKPLILILALVLHKSWCD